MPVHHGPEDEYCSRAYYVPSSPRVGHGEPFGHGIDAAKQTMQGTAGSFRLKAPQPFGERQADRRRGNDHKQRNVSDRKQCQMGIAGEQEKRDEALCMMLQHAVAAPSSSITSKNGASGCRKLIDANSAMF